MDSPDLLRAIATVALAVCVASLLLLALPRLLRRRFGAGVAYAAWWLLPLSLIAACLPARTVEIAAQAAPPVAAPSLPALIVPLAAAAFPSATTDIDVPWWPLLSLVWLVGAMFMAWRLWRQQRRFERGLGRLRALRDDLWQAQSRAGLPALLGVVRARIVLPEDFLSRYDHRERRLMLAHERQHRRRGDHLANFAMAALRCAFWFNPLVHLAAARFRHDQELACDQAVIAAHPDSRRAYGEAMLKTLMADRQAPLGCHWGSSHPLKERVMQLKSPLPRAGARRLGAAVVATLALGSGFAVWSAQPARTVSVPAIAGAQPQADALADASALNDGVYIYVDVDDPASREVDVPRIALWLKPGGSLPVEIDSEDAQGAALSASLAFSIERDARGGMTAIAKVLSDKIASDEREAASTAAVAQVLRLPVDAERYARAEHPIGTRGDRLVIQARRAPGPCSGRAAAKTGDAATFRCFDRPRAGVAAAATPTATIQLAGRGAVPPPPPAPPEPPPPPAPPAAPAPLPPLEPLASLAPLPPPEPEDRRVDFDLEAPPAPPAPPVPPAPPAPPSMSKREHVVPQAERIAMAARAERDAARAAQVEAHREVAAAKQAAAAARAEVEAARLARASAAREAANAERAVAAARAEQEAALAAAARAAKAAADAADRE